MALERVKRVTRDLMCGDRLSGLTGVGLPDTSIATLNTACDMAPAGMPPRASEPPPQRFGAADVEGGDPRPALEYLDKILYSIGEVERMLSLSHSTIYRLVAANRLDARKIGGKTVITAESIGRFLEMLPKAGGMPR